MGKHIKTAIQWGIIGGLSMVAFRTIIYLIAPMSLGNWDNAFYLPLLFCMVWGAVTAKRDAGGEMTYGQAFLIVFLISTIAVAINTLYAMALIKIIDTELGTKLYNHAIQQAEIQWDKRGMTSDQMDMARKWIDWIFKSPIFVLIMLAFQIIIGAIISLIIAAFVKRTNKPTAV